MSRMKHLLRKLHIGSSSSSSSNEEHQTHPQTQTRLTDTNTVSSSSSSPSPLLLPSDSSPSSLPSSTPPSSTTSNSSLSSIRALDSTAAAVAAAAIESSADYNFFEEEYQVQLALAISASDSDGREDPESVQIKAAKRMSLAVPRSFVAGETLVEFLSLRYWNYNVVNYEEKVMDGFYDVYGINPGSTMQGKIPLLVDLQATSISDDIDFEVIYVNRTVDPALQELEQKAASLAAECEVLELNSSGLVQKISDLVVNTMGGPVGDADEILRRWVSRSYELRSSLNTIVLPLGRLDVGLSRHRALLFKVLADRINLPCRLVKGSNYTGSNDGAVNLIKLGCDSEYIIDLMGAPGALIPVEIPTNHLENSTLDVKDTSVVFDKVNHESENKNGAYGSALPDPGPSPKVGISGSKTSATDAPSVVNDVNHSEKNQTDRFEYEFGKLLPSLRRSGEGSSGTSVKASPAQKMKVKDVSKYVISAAQNPEFAQKLHAVLLESGASPPPDLFSDLTPRHDLGEQKVVQNHFTRGAQRHGDESSSRTDSSLVPFRGMESINEVDSDIRRKSQQIGSFNSNLHSVGDTNFISQGVCLPISTIKEGYVLVDNGVTVPVNFSTAALGTSDNEKGKTKEAVCSLDCQQSTEESPVKLVETSTNVSNIASHAQNDRINQVFDEVSEWEIPWEDIHIGERIGLGSCGEVYRADWNGTEVAVKKFLDQDFSGDALEQFRCEVKIMLRLRHPNVVLFMGAVTRPPNLSILTEFLPRGSLYRLLHRPNIQLDEKRRLRMALDVAKGMNYLHTSHPTIVHRDLKSPNLLVDKNWVVKVCDFGLSRLKHHTFLSSKSTAGTELNCPFHLTIFYNDHELQPEWMAPEVLRNEPSNEKCDVYSFGVILWELATLRMPWNGMNPMQVVGAVGFQNRRLEIPEDIDPTVAQIISDCWQRGYKSSCVRRKMAERQLGHK
ncbi:hypothetical protein GIB67_005897 [Kingdonia uniflora]|uniref:non-specific serine/threonine protein kinase n=1 Tax=Kingdonia uniflora TaxID=39325 RepID=A0A7J7MBH9_9MAGN|nr:hypothetical protein GIB67_005897 [Kingdonia uniflora]